MKHLLRLSLLVAVLTPVPGRAQMQTYYHAGAWDAFSGKTDTGSAVCGVGTTIPADGRRFSIRFDIGGTDTQFSASKPDWSVPADTQVTVVMQIGLGTPWTVRASGHGQALDWTLDPAGMVVFDRQFRGAASMTVTFPDGNEAPWTLSLDGSTAVSDTFGRCVGDLTRQVQAAQPQDSAPENLPPAGATQPFAPSTPAPVQPPR